MRDKLVISIDAMGGANAPLCIIEAIEIVAKSRSDILFVLHGDKSTIELILSDRASLKDICEIKHSSTVVSDEDQPLKALKSGKESSMYKSIMDVKNGDAHACISSGNTGALMVMAKMILGTLSGVKRPAICSYYPSVHEGTILLDLGANSDCDVNNFFQFAVMGACFAKVVKGVENPRIGVLNIGVEEYKGREIERKTHEMLKQSSLNYIGFAEPNQLSTAEFDVVVTDGFSGNIVIKTTEGIAKHLKSLMKSAFSGSVLGRICGLLMKVRLRKIFKVMDPRFYNGAMFIGLKGIVVKSHGSSDHIAFYNALQKTISLAENDINGKIQDLFLSQSHDDKNFIEKIKHKLGF